MIVVDTNLLVYLWTGGLGEQLAEAVLLRDAGWVAPLLWRSEFRNAAAGLVRARRRTLEEVAGASETPSSRWSVTNTV